MGEDTGFKIFGREPTLWLAGLSSLIIVAGTFGFHLLTGQQAVLLVAAINAVFGAITAYTVRPISPVAFTYAVGAIGALLAGYAINVPSETVAAINAAVIPILALLSRGQVSPVDSAVAKITANPTAEAALKGAAMIALALVIVHGTLTGGKVF